MSFFNAEMHVTVSKIPGLPTEVLDYILYEAEEGEFPEEVVEAAQEEESKREDPGCPQHDDTPSLQDRGLYPGSYAS